MDPTPAALDGPRCSRPQNPDAAVCGRGCSRPHTEAEVQELLALHDDSDPAWLPSVEATIRRILGVPK